MPTAHSVAVNSAAIIAAVVFLVGAQADLFMMVRMIGAGAGCYSLVLKK